MNFDLQSLQNTTAMKKVLRALAAILPLIVLSSCASSGFISESADRRNLDEEVVRNAVESRKFIIKLERLYTNGGFMDLRPRTNYIIVDGRKAIINAAYYGRQHDVRPIAGINMQGVASNYEITRRISRDMYDIRLRVDNGATSFDVYLTIGKNGSANASVNSLKIDNARYMGYVVPLSEEVRVPLQDNGVI